jgi:hypothetical protein
MRGNPNSSSRHTLPALFLTSTVITTREVVNLKLISLVVVMSAVELWKAQQALLSQRTGVDLFKWRLVGIGENSAFGRQRTRKIKISSTTLNRISTFSPTTIHRASFTDFRPHAEDELDD